MSEQQQQKEQATTLLSRLRGQIKELPLRYTSTAFERAALAQTLDALDSVSSELSRLEAENARLREAYELEKEDAAQWLREEGKERARAEHAENRAYAAELRAAEAESKLSALIASVREVEKELRGKFANPDDRDGCVWAWRLDEWADALQQAIGDK